MRMKPIRFVGHKIGPFVDIELNWTHDDRYTLIVGENGSGKTTLVAAIAACLSFGDDTLLPRKHFDRFAHDEQSFAYLEVKAGEEKGWLLRWGPQTHRAFFGIEALGVLSDAPYVFRLASMDVARVSTVGSNRIRIEKPRELPPLEGPFVFIEALSEAGIPSMQGACSFNLVPVLKSWATEKQVTTLAAAYGVNRDIQQPTIRENQDFDSGALTDILNPFAPMQSSAIFQWAANQYIYYALAAAENKKEEARAYLAAIRRVETLLSEELGYPITFEVKRNPFRLEVRQNGLVLPVDQLSDGARGLLSWPLDYLMRASRVNWANPADSTAGPGLVLLDEIDAHLHPGWQRRVMKLIHHLLPETYVIATTHSPFVLGAADDAQIFLLRRQEDGRLSAHSSFGEMYGYPADLILEKAFVPSLYAPELEKKLNRLSELVRRLAESDISSSERCEHDKLRKELARANPWLDSLLALSSSKGHRQ